VNDVAKTVLNIKITLLTIFEYT